MIYPILKVDRTKSRTAYWIKWKYNERWKRITKEDFDFWFHDDYRKDEQLSTKKVSVYFF